MSQLALPGVPMGHEMIPHHHTMLALAKDGAPLGVATTIAVAVTGEGASPSLRSGSEQGGVCGRCGEGLCRPVANDLAGDTLDRLWEGCSPTPVFGNRAYRVREETARRSCHLAVKRSWKSGRPLATSVAIGLSQMPSTPVQNTKRIIHRPGRGLRRGDYTDSKDPRSPLLAVLGSGGSRHLLITLARYS